MLETWAAQLEQIERVANAWCNFALVCGVIGLVLSVACAAWLIWNNTINQKNKSDVEDG